MPAKGRRGTTVPTPPTLKLLEGRGNGKDSGGREVKPTPGFTRLPPEMPEEVEWDEIASTEWTRVVAELQRLNLTKPIDAPALAVYCLSWSRFCAAQSLVRTKGITAETSQGEGVAPWVRVAEQAARQMLVFAHEFGLTPSAESRLSSPEADSGEENPFASGGA